MITTMGQSHSNQLKKHFAFLYKI